MSKSSKNDKNPRDTYNSRVDGCPSEQDAEIKSNARMQAKQDLSARFDDIVQRPCVAPAEKRRFNVNVVEPGGYVGDDPLFCD